MNRRIQAILENQGLRQFCLYALCGGSGVLVDFGSYAGLLHAGLNYQIANFVGYLLGTLVSFGLNRHFTFQAYDNTLRRLAMFLGAASVGYAISVVLLWVLVEKIALDPLIAKLLTLFVVLVVQFTINRSITFRNSTKK